MFVRTEDLLFHDQMEIRPQENQNSWLPLLRMYTDVRIQVSVCIPSITESDIAQLLRAGNSPLKRKIPITIKTNRKNGNLALTALYFNKNVTITTMQKDHTINKTDLKLGTSECCDLNGTFLRKSGQYVQRKEKTATTHAKKRKPLTIGTLAPLHRSLSQQCTSQVLTSYPRPSTNLHAFLQSEIFAQFFTKLLMVVPLFSASIWAFTQASESEGHVVSFLLTQSAQLFCEPHWQHLIPCPTNESKNSVFPFSVVVVLFFFCSFMVLVASRSRQAFSVFRSYIWEFLGNLISWNSLKQPEINVVGEDEKVRSLKFLHTFGVCHQELRKTKARFLSWVFLFYRQQKEENSDYTAPLIAFLF